MNERQALIVAQNQFALLRLTDQQLQLILPVYRKAIETIVARLRTLPEGSVEREFWLKQQLANIRGQFKALGKRIEDVVPAGSVQAWEMGLQSAEQYMQEIKITAETTQGIRVSRQATVPAPGVSTSSAFVSEANPLGEFLRPAITPQQIFAAAKSKGFATLAPGGVKRSLEDVLPGFLKAEANIIEKKLRTGFLLSRTNDEIIDSIWLDRRGRSQVEAIVRTSMMESSQAARDAFTEQNQDFSWVDADGGVREVKLVDKFEWDASLDNRVCPICAPLDGLTKEKRSEMPSYPAHFNCRCAILPVSSVTEELRKQGDLKKRTVGEMLRDMSNAGDKDGLVSVLGSQKMADRFEKEVKKYKDPQRLVVRLLSPKGGK